MKKKLSYCLFCGSEMPALAASRGVYLENTCLEPSCPHHGTESSNEYEGLTIFSTEDWDDDTF